MKNFLKSLPVVLLLCFVITCVSFNAFADETTGEIGDVNYDGNINATDALEVLKHAAKITTIDATYADVSRDSRIDATDALWILKFAARLIPDLSWETISATPAPTATPVPVADNIAKLKNHIKTNGYQEDTVYYIPYSVSDDGTLNAYLTYYSSEDLLQLELSYYAESGSEASAIELAMPLTGKNTESIFFVGYENVDYNYSEYLEAKASINISTITYSSTVNYTKTDSYNVDDSQLTTIYQDASTMTTDSLSIWNYMITEEIGIGLKYFGFSKL